MANILDYIIWRGDLTLEQDPFHEVDALILSTLIYVEFENADIYLRSGKAKTVKEIGELFAKNCCDEKIETGRLIPKQIIQLLDMMSRSKRYQDMKLSRYINQVDETMEKQFAAVLIEPGDGTLFIAFRGTDDTIIGWKEDFNMCFKSPVPSQLQAVEYVDMIASGHKGFIRLGGHSKGGNLSVFSAAFCQKEVRGRIQNVYNFDGPGFTNDILSEIEKTGILSKVRTVIPRSSVIGMLMEHEEDYDVVSSTSNGIFQHDPFSWEVQGKSFVEMDVISARAYKLDHSLSDFMAHLDTQQKKELIDTVFGIFMQTGAKTLSEISIKDIPQLMKNLREEDAEKKQLLLQTFKILLQSSHVKQDVKKLNESSPKEL